jgi:hypothetical protein
MPIQIDKGQGDGGVLNIFHKNRNKPATKEMVKSLSDAPITVLKKVYSKCTFSLRPLRFDDI